MADSSTVGPGTVLGGRYELTDIIGRGGFGTVWKARQLNMDRDVAIKILPSQFMAIKDVVERFKREAKLASRLRHPNTITLHDYGQHENLLYIVMELLTGEDLADLLKREGRLPPERIMHIARQVLKSLAEAHEEHIVHRDLKPENIFLSVVGDDRDHVKVVDFGIAKLAQPTAAGSEDEDSRRLTMSGSTVGTPTYMSPEQAAGEDVDGQTDLYALGVIMYEAACGRPPFHHKDPVKVMRAQLFEAVPPLRDERLRGTLLDRVVMKALMKERDQRFQTAHEMLLALAGEPVARPVIKGIPFDQLDEPSTQDIDLSEVEDAPNTDDFAPDKEKRFPSTLAYAKSVKPHSDETADADPGGDAIPFGAVHSSAGEGRDPVRSSVSSENSTAGEPTPPSQEETSGSSILTVIEPSESDADVILLTKRKTPESSQALDHGVSSDAQSTTSDPEQRANPHVGGQAVDEQDVGDRPVRARAAEAGVAPEPGEAATGRDGEIYKSWEWQGSEPVEVASTAAVPPTPRQQSSAIWYLVGLLIVAAGFTMFFFDDVNALLFGSP